MKTVIVTLRGVSPYSQSRAIQSKKTTGENHDAFEDRTWKERLHVNEDKYVFVPPMSIKNCLSDVAKYLSETVPGRGKATYTKHFEAGLLCTKEAVIKPFVTLDTIESERLFVPADGHRGGSTRVWKTFPIIRQWTIDAEIVILDPILIDKTEKIIEYLEYAGKFIGIGRFRPRNNGYYGRFEVIKSIEI
jgi:hypothetical protein